MQSLRAYQARAADREGMLMRNLTNNTPTFTPVTMPVTSVTVAVRDKIQRKQIVNVTLLVIVVFQLVNLPGALRPCSVLALTLAAAITGARR
jgi:hypothetical protein